MKKVKTAASHDLWAGKEKNFVIEALSLYYKPGDIDQEFQCLRCGACCLIFDVRWTGRIFSLSGFNCPFLIPRRLVQEKDGWIWAPSQCQIHESERPPACTKFETIWKLSGPCPIGRAVWKHTKKMFPETRVPAWIKQALVEKENGLL